MLNSYFELKFAFVKRADNSSYANGNNIRLVILGPIALFSKIMLTTSSGKHLEDFSHAHIASSIYKLISNAKDTYDFSLGFDNRCDRRRDELTGNENVKRKYHLRIMLRDVFGFAKHQKKATYGLGYKLTPTRNKDDAVIDKAAGNADARSKIDRIHWHVPHYTPSIQQQGILSKEILSKTPTELRYNERSFFMKEVNNQNLWNFELGSQEKMNVPYRLL